MQDDQQQHHHLNAQQLDSRDRDVMQNLVRQFSQSRKTHVNDDIEGGSSLEELEDKDADAINTERGN